MDILSLQISSASPFAPDAATDAASAAATPFAAVLADVPVSIDAVSIDAATIVAAPVVPPIDAGSEMAPGWYRPPVTGGGAVPTERVDGTEPVLAAAVKTSGHGTTVPTGMVDATIAGASTTVVPVLGDGTVPVSIAEPDPSATTSQATEGTGPAEAGAALASALAADAAPRPAATIDAEPAVAKPAKTVVPRAGGTTVPTPVADGTAAAPPATAPDWTAPPRVGGTMVPTPVADGTATTAPASPDETAPIAVVDTSAQDPLKGRTMPAGGATVPTPVAGISRPPAPAAVLRDPDVSPRDGARPPVVTIAPTPGTVTVQPADAVAAIGTVRPDDEAVPARSSGLDRPSSTPAAPAVVSPGSVGGGQPAVVAADGRNALAGPGRAARKSADPMPETAASSIDPDAADPATKPAGRKRVASFVEAGIPTMSVSATATPAADPTPVAEPRMAVRTPADPRPVAPANAAPIAVGAAAAGEADAPVLSALIAVAAGTGQAAPPPVLPTATVPAALDRAADPAASSTVTMLAGRTGMAAAKAAAPAVAAATAGDAASASPAARRTVRDRPIMTDAAAAPAGPSDATPTITATVDIAGAQLAAGATDRHVEVARHAAWADGIARDIASAGAATGTTRFSVAPAALGAVAVELTRSESGTDVRLTATSGAARDALDQARPQLVAEARAQGLHIREALVDLGGDTAGKGTDRHRSDPHAQQAVQPTLPDRQTTTVSETNSLTPGSYGGGVGGDAGAQARQQQAQHQASPSRTVRASAGQPAPDGQSGRGDAARPADGRYA